MQIRPHQPQRPFNDLRRFLVHREEGFVPIKLHARADLQATLLAGKATGEIDGDRLRLAARKTHKRHRFHPTAATVGHPQRRWLGQSDPRIVRQPHVERRIRGIDPAGEEQCDAGRGGEPAEIELQAVRLDHPLPDLVPKRRGEVAVRPAHRLAPIASVQVADGRRSALPPDGVDPMLGQFGRSHLLVGEDFDIRRVIDGDQAYLIEVGGFPQLLGDLQMVAAVPGDQLIAADEQILPRPGRRQHTVCLLKTDGRCP